MKRKNKKSVYKNILIAQFVILLASCSGGSSSSTGADEGASDDINAPVNNVVWNASNWDEANWK